MVELRILAVFWLLNLQMVVGESYGQKWHRIMKRFGIFFENDGYIQDPPIDHVLNEAYDFIIVGSGSSGSVLASRLSENPSWNILLLEAGNPANLLTKVPILAPVFQLTPYNWNYTMEPQVKSCQAMESQICACPRGKALGGSSVINYMIYTRGNPKDYQKWYENGNPGWVYEDVLPYYKKSERCRLGAEICSNGYHNVDGLLSTEYPFKSRITDAFLDAGVEIGGKVVEYNSEDYMGFGQIQATIDHGKRHSVADAFIYPFWNSRRNLQVLTSARVTKIVIDPKTKTAKGVEFRKKGKKFVVKATKEVILSAGVFNSPQLLMLSGIGPKYHLEELGIPLIQNLPVGQTLYDHIAYLGIAYKINQTVEPPEAIFNPIESFRWLFNGKGVFTSLGGIEALGYINTGSNPDPSYPDIELIFVGAGSLDVDYGLAVAKEIRLKQDIYDKVFKPLEPIPTYTIFPMLLHPKSKGFLKLRSTNPYDPPLVFGNFLTDEDDQDVKTLLAGIRFVQKLSETEAFQKFGATMSDIPIPGCEKEVFDSDEYWICALRSLTSTLHHQIGTCKMGNSSDGEAVVDARLGVHGMKKLRVVDASVIPVTLSAHTNAPAIMIGEKGADIIKEDYGIKIKKK